MASIVKRGNFWRTQIRRKGYEPQSQTFDTKQEAQAWARSIEGKMDRGVFISRKEVEQTTLREAIERYKLEVTPSKKGAKQEIDRFKIILRDPLCDMVLAGIHGKDIGGFRDRRLKVVSPSTVQRDLNTISHVFTIIMKDWSMPLVANPVQLIRRPKVPASSARTRRLVGDEEARLLAACRRYKGQWLEAIAAFAIETAMRRGELFKMAWENTNLKNRTAHIDPDNSKTSKARDVPLTTHAVHILKSLPRSLSGSVFQFKSAEQISTQFSRACKITKNSQGEFEPIEDLRFHDLRHEATSRLFEKGLSTEQVMRITGHLTYTMLARYTHLRMDEDMMMKLG